MKKYTHAACFISCAGTLAFSHYVNVEDFPYWKGMIFLPLEGLFR
jgi:hypothetical protein